MDMSQLRSEETLDHGDRGAPRAPTIDVDTERTGVRAYAGRGLPRSGRGLEWSCKRLAFYHDPFRLFS
jgi:bacterioferritin-associated ferredoxin